MLFNRLWEMPNPKTFSIKCIAELLQRYITKGMVVVDPFAKDSFWGTITNDLDTESSATHHMSAIDFLDMLIKDEVKADVVLLDPPYSPRQISECYKSIGLKVTQTDTQNARLYKECKDRLMSLLKPSGIAICFGWNSTGFGKKRGFELLEILLVCHGGSHNDTICTVEQYIPMF